MRKARDGVSVARALTLTVGLLVIGPIACAHRTIPNTDVDDTTDHRAIVTFCEAYRKAVERKDIPGLLRMASPDYYEDGGNVDASDDIDYAGLEKYLRTRYAYAYGIRYEIRYRRITTGDSYILVDYTYSGSFRLKTNEGEKWRSTVEENRLELVRDGETFYIVAGM